MTVFQPKLGKMIPEWQAVLHFIETRAREMAVLSTNVQQWDSCIRKRQDLFHRNHVRLHNGPDQNCIN